MSDDAEVKDTVLSALQHIGAELQSGYSAGKEFVSEQAPEVAREIVTWGIVGNGIWAAFWLAVTIGFGWFAFRWWRKCGDDFEGALGIVPSLILGFIAALLTVNYIGDTLEVAVAPRVYLLKQGVKIAQGKL